MGSAGFIKYFKIFVEVFTAFIENAAENFNCTPIHVLMLCFDVCMASPERSLRVSMLNWLL